MVVGEGGSGGCGGGGYLNIWVDRGRPDMTFAVDCMDVKKPNYLSMAGWLADSIFGWLVGWSVGRLVGLIRLIIDKVLWW